MKKKLIYLTYTIVAILSSCQYPTFQINGKDALKLKHKVIDSEMGTKRAYLIDYSNNSAITDNKVREEVSKFYDIEGYELIVASKEEEKKLKDVTDYHLYGIEYSPYSYRNYFIKGNDTIASITNNNRNELYTHHKYTSNDTILLKEAMEYLGLSSCYLFNSPIYKTNYYTKYNKCYAMYNDYNYSYHKWLFIDEVSNGNIYNLESNVRVRISKNEKLYINYDSNIKLTKEQIAEVVKQCSEDKSKKIIYFYVNDYPDGGYATYMDNTISMFDENKIYKIDYNENGEWKLVLLKAF